MSLGNLLFAAIPALFFLPVLLWGYIEAQQVKRSPEWYYQRFIVWVQKDLPEPTPPVNWKSFEDGVWWYLYYDKPLDIPWLLKREEIHER